MKKYFLITLFLIFVFSVITDILNLPSLESYRISYAQETATVIENQQRKNEEEVELTILKIQGVIDELAPLRKVEAYQKRLGMVAPEEGKALQMLIEISSAKNVLEIGTGCGFSALWMSKGLIKTGGKLVTIDSNPKMVKLAKENIKKAGVEDIVTVIEGDAVKAIPKLKNKFDIVFSDASKMDNLIYFGLFMPLVKVGGLITAHDATGGESWKMRDYLDMLKTHPSLDTIIITDETCYPDIISGPGLVISYKKDSRLDHIENWSRNSMKSVVKSKLEEIKRPLIDYEVLKELLDDAGNEILYILVDEKKRKDEIIQLCMQLLWKYNYQSRILFYIYNNKEAFDNRNNFTYPSEKYFHHFIAQVYRNPYMEFDEIRWYPKRLVLLFEKHISKKGTEE